MQQCRSEHQVTKIPSMGLDQGIGLFQYILLRIGRDGETGRPESLGILTIEHAVLLSHHQLGDVIDQENHDEDQRDEIPEEYGTWCDRKEKHNRGKQESGDHQKQLDCEVVANGIPQSDKYDISSTIFIHQQEPCTDEKIGNYQKVELVHICYLCSEFLQTFPTWSMSVSASNQPESFLARSPAS